MAGADNLSRSLKGGHEPFYDFSCVLCEKEGRHVEAVKFCDECSVYMCISCIKYHNRFPLNARHKLLDQSQFITISKSSLTRCINHPGELINIFCGDHGVVCCSVCKTVQHSTCKNMQNLADAAKGIHRSYEYQRTKNVTQTLLSDVCKSLSDRKTNVYRVAKEREQAEQIIADFRKKANTYFDKLERNSLDELKLRENRIVSSLDQETAFLKNVKSKAEDIIKQMKVSERNNECELFVLVKMGKQYVDEAMEKMKEISETEQKGSIQFKINPEIEDYFSSVDVFGTFADTDKSASPPESESKETTDPDFQQSTFIPAHCVYQPSQYCRSKAKLHMSGKFNLKEISDSQVCHIVDICQLVDGSILVTDKENMKLKRLDKTYTFVDSIRLTSGPHSVCEIGPREAAVTLFIDKKIQFVSIGNQLALKTTFSTGSYCRGLSYKNGKLYVCCGDVHEPSSGCIKVFNNAGEFLYSFPLASVPIRITACDYSQHLFITSWKSDDVFMLDYSGNIISTFSDDDLRFPLGICTDGKGRVFVNGYSSDTVVKISPRSKKIEVLLGQDNNIKKLKGVCCDKIRSRLLVSCLNSNELLVFSLE
ncbi:uncharacterized protein LOC123542058 [Mercenaria mercenaria]|uniref:uncharacterized protein LOC123542058 n=1 Tax=Mercenaria mercenaria TaxID=6596 RepID=UPI00234EE4EF|nr:uncharacterized protein LOC123542058 [Mercenaria mercenaria]